MSLHGVGPIYGMTKIWNETTWATFTKNPKYEMGKIQFTKWKKSNLRNETFSYYYWKYPKYEMKKSNLRNETFLYYYKICKIRNEMSNLRNGLVVFRKYVIYEMTKWQRKMSNLRNGLVVFKKYPIYEMTCRHFPFSCGTCNQRFNFLLLENSWNNSHWR